MKRYNPDQPPNPAQWLALDEQTRIRLIDENHRAAHIKLPNVTIHVVIHSIVENQIAENIESVVSAMDRLMAEGLSRHEAVHAIGSVLAEHIYDLLNNKADETNSSAIYNAAIERLTAKSWLNS